MVVPPPLALPIRAAKCQPPQRPQRHRQGIAAYNPIAHVELHQPDQLRRGGVELCQQARELTLRHRAGRREPGLARVAFQQGDAERGLERRNLA